MRKLQISVIGSKTLDLNKEQDKAAWDFAYKIGFALGRTINSIVLVSGNTGVSEAVTKGATDAGGTTVNIVSGDYKEDNALESQITIASTMNNNEHCWPVIYSSDCVIAIGGGIDTGIQISLAVDLGLYVVIYSKAGGISSEVFTSLEPTFQKMRSSQLVYLVDNDEEAIDRAKLFALDRVKRGLKIDAKLKLDLPKELELIGNKNRLSILTLLTTNKSLSPQEISDQLKIPLLMVISYLEELDAMEIVMAKKTIADEHLFSLNLDNAFTQKLVKLITSTFKQYSTEEDT